MERLGLAHQKDPILDYKPLKNFVFMIIMATEEDTCNILNLSGIIFMNRDLVIKRPRNYNGDSSDVFYYKYEELLGLWETRKLSLLTSGPPSKILIFSNIKNYLNPADQAETNDKILRMFQETSELFGQVESIKLTQDVSNNINVLIKMSTVEEAVDFLHTIKGRPYNNNLVHVQFYPEAMFVNNIYDAALPHLVLTKSHGEVPLETVMTPAVFHSIMREREKN